MRTLFVTTPVAEYPGRGSILEREELVPIPQTTDAPTASPALRKAVTTAGSPAERVLTDGKFFRVGANKFYPKGVTYGPFKPDAAGCTFPAPEQVARDFELIQKLNANCVRTYHVPPRWFLDLAHEHDLKVLWITTGRSTPAFSTIPNRWSSPGARRARPPKRSPAIPLFSR